MRPANGQPRSRSVVVFRLIHGLLPLWGIALSGAVVINIFANQLPSYDTPPEGCFTVQWGAYSAICYLALALALLALVQARGMARLADGGWLAGCAAIPLCAGAASLGLGVFTIGQYVYGPRVNCGATSWPTSQSLDFVVNGIIIASLGAVVFGFVALAIFNLRQRSPAVATMSILHGALFTRLSGIIAGFALIGIVPLALLQSNTPPAQCWEYTGTSVIQFALAQDVLALILGVIALGISRRTNLTVIPLLGATASLAVAGYAWAQSYHIDRRCYGYTPNADPFAHTATWLGPAAAFTYLGFFAIMLIVLVALNTGRRGEVGV